MAIVSTLSLIVLSGLLGAGRAPDIDQLGKVDDENLPRHEREMAWREVAMSAASDPVACEHLAARLHMVDVADRFTFLEGGVCAGRTVELITAFRQRGIDVWELYPLLTREEMEERPDFVAETLLRGTPDQFGELARHIGRHRLSEYCEFVAQGVTDRRWVAGDTIRGSSWELEVGEVLLSLRDKPCQLAVDQALSVVLTLLDERDVPKDESLAASDFVRFRDSIRSALASEAAERKPVVRSEKTRLKPIVPKLYQE